jgi:hypothetical protein
MLSSYGSTGFNLYVYQVHHGKTVTQPHLRLTLTSTPCASTLSCHTTLSPGSTSLNTSSLSRAATGG